ncbi:MAG: phosphate ABC transporter substrate-binding protein [Planctomycetota bacterium]|nr:phosphate ABC transporter substrate-binding protein [Planctomycetota bacterium]
MPRAFTLLGLLALAGCGAGVGTPNAKPATKADAAHAADGEKLEGKLVVTGSSTCAPLVAEIGKRFEQRHPGVRVDVQTGGSSRGVADPQTGIADLGMASRALKEDEARLVQAHTLALDGICVILNKANPVTELGDAQVAAIYTGKIGTWNEVGGSEAAITVVNKAEGRSTLELFLRYFELKSANVKASVVIGDNEQGLKTVAGNPDAIGYVSVGAAESAARSGAPIKLLPMNGVAATVENIRNGSFPLARPLNLVTLPNPTGLKKAFIEFALSKEVHDLIREQSFVPVE